MKEEAPEYDLEERTFLFALSVRNCISSHRWTRVQWADVDQLLRSSGSVAANYTEANNSVSKADFAFRIKVSKKESRESMLWLRLLGESSKDEGIRSVLRSL